MNANAITAERAHAAAPRTVDPLYRFEAHLTLNPIGPGPEGLRFTNPFEGTVTGGELAAAGFAGARVWGIDPFLLRSDGVGIIDASKTITAGDGRQIYEHVQGYCLAPEGIEMPPLEALMAPGFEWPPVSFPIVATCRWRTAVPELDHLNRALGAIEGSVDLSTGRLRIETRVLARDGHLVVPEAIL